MHREPKISWHRSPSSDLPVWEGERGGSLTIIAERCATAGSFYSSALVAL